jgi:hypothetical protein
MLEYALAPGRRRIIIIYIGSISSLGDREKYNGTRRGGPANCSSSLGRGRLSGGTGFRTLVQGGGNLGTTATGTNSRAEG